MSEPKPYPIHPACAKWPRPSAAEFEALVADIKANGLLYPVTLTAANEILEGKVRYEACLAAGVEPRFETYRGDDPIGFTISHNKLRRHLSIAELAFIGNELAVLQNGTNRYEKKLGACAQVPIPAAQDKVAQQLGIGKTMIQAVRALKQYGESNVVEMARTGQVGLQNAANYVRHTPREKQRMADCNTVKHQGQQLRSPQNNFHNKRVSSSKKVSEIEFSSEQWQVLSEKLRPLIKRLRYQSKQHITLFAPFELELIAFEMDKLLDQWANAGTGATRAKASNQE